MPDYYTHRNSGLERGLPIGLLTFLLSVAIFDSLISAVLIGIGTVFLTLLGSIFPDIDHHSSIPFRRLKWLTASVFTLVGAWIYFEIIRYFIETSDRHASPGIIGYQLGMGIILIPLAGTIGIAIVEYLRPKHRGITHTKLAGAVMGTTIGVAILYWYSPSPEGNFLAITAAGAFYMGAVDHLSLDGLVGRESIQKISSSYSGYVAIVNKWMAVVLSPFRKFGLLLIRRIERAPLKVKILALITGLVFLIVLYVVVRWAFSKPSRTYPASGYTKT